MGQTIREMFGAADEAEGSDAEFDLDTFMADADKLIASSNDRQYAASGIETEPAPAPVATTPAPDPGGEQEEETEEEAEEEPAAAAATPPAPAPAPSDPLADIPPERRAALLALDQVMQRDPAKAESVLRGLSTVETAIAPPAATLPEDIEPGSFEARQWTEQQEIKAQLHELTTASRVQQETFAKQQAATAAQQAGSVFAAKYAGQLEEADVLAIARQAGESGIAGVLASTPEGQADLSGAYTKALEHVLWTDETYRSKVTTVAAPVPVAEQPESKDRKRKLNALSSAATPVSGPSPKRSPLESREDGRLTPKSRMDLVKELAGGLNREKASDGMY